MGMSIDEAIIQATLLKDGISKDKYKYEILTTLIDTAKKYQKIEQILDDCDLEAWEILEKVKEVVEDDK